MRHLSAVLSLFLLAVCATAHAETVIVSDYLPINVRAPGPEDKIIAAVKSGERLVVLERAKGYLKVRTGKGTEGWVLERFVQTEPVAQERLDKALAARDAAVAAETQATTALKELQARFQELDTAHTALTEKAAALTTELTSVRKAAASTLQIQQANAALQEEVAGLNEQVASLQADMALQDNRRSTMILGAGILLTGLLLGLIAPFLRPRRSSWSDF